MYKDNSQLRIEDFVFPYGKLDPENDWVRLAAILAASVPQTQTEEKDDPNDGNDPPNSGTPEYSHNCL